MKHPRDDSAAHARQEYNKLLARLGLVDFTPEEFDRARLVLESQGCRRITIQDLQFQAAAARLRSRTDLSLQAVEDAIKEILDAEYEYNQAVWERECFREASTEHSNFNMPHGSPGDSTKA